MKKLLLILALAVLFISSASAVDNIGTFKTGDSFELIQICDSCTYVNLSSVVFPNGTLTDFTNTSMTKTGYNYNYTYSTLVEGEYQYFVCGDKLGTLRCEQFDFSVTPTGESQKSFSDNPLLLILLFLGILLMAAGIWHKVATLGFLGAVSFILAGMYAMIYGINSVTNLYTRASAGVLIAVGIFFLFISTYEWFQED